MPSGLPEPPASCSEYEGADPQLAPNTTGRQIFGSALRGSWRFVRVSFGASVVLFGPLVALTLALVLVLGVIGEPFGGSGAVPEICIKLADFDTDLRNCPRSSKRFPITPNTSTNARTSAKRGPKSLFEQN